MEYTTDRNDPCLKEIREDGQQECHIVLPDEQRKKFVRPIRQAYIHEKCGVVTTMGLKLAETYAVNPQFYGGTFCAHCHDYFPVGEKGEFVWDDDGTKVGT